MCRATESQGHWTHFFSSFSFGCPQGTGRFQGQGWNPSHSSDNAESLTTRPQGNSWAGIIFRR